MLARRVIAISPDKAFAKRMAQALKAAGSTVESYEGLDALGNGEIQAGLLVLHLEGDAAAALPAIGERLADDAHIIAVLSKSSIASSVAVMLSTKRLAGVIVAEDMVGADLGAMATRVLYGDIFGVEKLVPWGTRVYSALVGDYQEKSLGIAQISEFAASMGVRRKYREAIEQCVDEMLMNALYDAPVDSTGKQIFADVPTKTRISLRMEQKAVVQYASTSELFVVSVRDPYGTLGRDTVLRYLHKCLHSEQQIDRKTGGAGLGLYIMANAATTFVFNVLPGVATECICAFDLTAAKGQLEQFGFFSEKIDAAGRLVAGPSRLLPTGASHPVERRSPSEAPPNRGVVIMLSAAVALMLTLVVMVAYPRLTAKGTGAVRITTVPPDARIDVEGRTRGTTTGGSYTVEGLELGRAYRVAANREGWDPAETVVEPSRDITNITLQLRAREAVVNVESDPPGAAVVLEGREIGKTPTSIATLPPGREIELLFRKPGFADLSRKVRVPAPGSEAYVSTTLVVSPEVASARLETEPPGAQIWLNDQLLVGLTTPVDEHLLEAGRPHRIQFKLAGFAPAAITITPARGARGVPVKATLQAGGAVSVRANVTGTATVVGVAACTRVPLPMVECPVPDGDYRVRVDGTRPAARVERKLAIAGRDATLEVELGFVEAKEGFQLVSGTQTVARIAAEEGKRTIIVVDKAGVQREVEVRLQAGKTVTVP